MKLLTRSKPRKSIKLIPSLNVIYIQYNVKLIKTFVNF